MHSIFGFLLGSTLSGAGLYYYVVDEYKVSNELLTEDVYVSITLGRQRKLKTFGLTGFRRSKQLCRGSKVT